MINLWQPLNTVKTYARLYTELFLIDDQSAWNLYGRSYIPQVYVIDPDGIVRYGRIDFYETDIRTVVRQWLPRQHDVRVLSITAPAGTLDSGTAIAPACSVLNSGRSAENFQVRMKIGSNYNATTSVSSLAPFARTYVTFPAWTAGPPGSLTVSCSTELAGDLNSANDRMTGSVTVLGAPNHDVGCTRIIAPPGLLDSGTTVTPACSVYNYGNRVETFTTRMKIGELYSGSATVSGLAAGARARVTFPYWTALPRGNLAVSCSTELSTDTTPTNDRLSGSVAVNVHDWSATAVIAPSGAVPPGTVTPRATVHNQGTSRETGTIVFSINSTPPYSQTVALSAGLPVGVDTTITFPDWTGVPGSFTAKCSTALSVDQVRANNRASANFQIGAVDVATTTILAPTGSIDSGRTITPSARVKNLGDLAATFAVAFEAKNSTDSTVYDESLTVTNLSAGVETTVVFPAWAKPYRLGDYTTACSTGIAHDGDPTNDLVTGAFTIFFVPPETGYTRKPGAPPGAKNKAVKDGGCLAYHEQTDVAGYVYALKGNGRYEFYQYSTAGDTWAAKESIPAVGSSGKKKAVKKGACMTAAGGSMYAAKGGGTLEWWKYDPARSGGPGYPWIEQAGIPTAAKPVKEGTGAAAVTLGDTTYVYFLRGSGGAEFLRYNPQSNTWAAMTPAPLGLSGKYYKDGSCLTYDEDRKLIYVLKGSYNEFFAYSVENGTWATMTSLPLIGSSGKKKKAKSGAGMAYHDGIVWTLKGGGTSEFWTFQCESNRWVQNPDLPAGSGKTVKGGGAIVYAAIPNALYIFKGNNTLDFFKYGLAEANSSQLTAHSSQPEVQNSGLSVVSCQLSAFPNPCGSELPLAISYSLPNAGKVSLKLYDITGKLVTTLAEGHHPAGRMAYSVERKALSSGIYLLKLATEASTTTTKLVIE